jgi:putative ABC transport system substrate-binding protein
MNNRRTLMIALGACTFAPTVAFAQKKLPRVGVLSPGTQGATAHFHEALKHGLREYGFVEGQNVIIERRFADGKLERLSELAAELVRAKVDVIVVGTDAGIAAVKQETQTIPIVMAGSTDPVGTGFVASLARPGGNVTGLSAMSPDLSGKRVEILNEVVSGLSRVAILWNPDIRGAVLDYNETLAAAKRLRLQLQSVELRRADDLDRAFSTLVSQRAQGLIVQSPNPVLFSNRGPIVSFAQKNRLPAIYGQADFVNDGGLMSYGRNNADGYRRAAYYVDRILKGAKPADLPVEQPTKFELVVNMKAAKALGVTIPQTILVRADRVIQ